MYLPGFWIGVKLGVYIPSERCNSYQRKWIDKYNLVWNRRRWWDGHCRSGGNVRFYNIPGHSAYQHYGRNATTTNFAVAEWHVTYADADQSAFR